MCDAGRRTKEVVIAALSSTPERKRLSRERSVPCLPLALVAWQGRVTQRAARLPTGPDPPWSGLAGSRALCRGQPPPVHRRLLASLSEPAGSRRRSEGAAACMLTTLVMSVCVPLPLA